MIASVVRVALSLVWLFIALAKAQAGFDTTAVEPYLPVGLALAATVGLVVLEALTGAFLLATPRLRSKALLASAAMLLLYGVGAILYQPEVCTCAGRVAPLGPLEHTLVVSTMLFMTGVASTEDRTRSELMKGRRLGLWVAGGLAAILVCMVAMRFWPQESESPAESARRVVAEPYPAGSATLRGVDDASSGDPTDAPQPRIPAQEGSHALRGVVQNVAGDDLPGATVWVASPGSGFLSRALAESSTDGDGRFSLAVGRSAVGANLHASLLGYKPTWVAISESDLTESVNLVLSRGRAIVGRVVGPDGGALSDVRVEALGLRGEDYVLSQARYGKDVMPSYGATTTDADGTFKLSGLAIGTYRIRADARGYYMPQAPADVTIAAHAGASSTEVILYPVRVVRLTVLDAQTGDVVKTASVSGRGKGLQIISARGYWQPTSADPQDPLLMTGTYVTYALPLVSDRELAVECHVQAPGYAPVNTSLTLQAFPGTSQSVRLRRRDEIVPVVARARFPGKTRGFSGILNLMLREQDHGESYRIPVRFVDGHTPKAIPMGTGTYEVWLEPAGGSGVYWLPASRKKVIDVTSATQTIELDLRGGMLRVRAVDGMGLALPEFSLSVVRTDVAGVTPTWEGQFPPDLASDGARVFWFPPGEMRIGVLKFGYEVSTREVVIPADGGSIDVEVPLTLK